MQSYLSRRSLDQRFSGGEFCEVISALTRDLTKARNQLVQLMYQVKPGEGRLYGGYSVPQKPPRTHATPCNGSNVRNRPAPRNSGCSNAYPSASVPPSRSLRSMTVHEANRLGQIQQRAPLRPQRKASNGCERPYNKAQQYPCERGTRSDMSDTSDSSGRSGQRDSTCVNITFDSPEPTPTARRPQRCRRDTTSTYRDSKPECFQDSRDPVRLQGGGGISRRHNCVGTQFATLLQDVTYQLRERRLAANILKPF